MAKLVDPFLPEGTMRRRTQPLLRVDGSLVLRPWVPADVPALVSAYADPDIQRWNLHSYDEAEASLLVARFAESWRRETSAHWAIARVDDDLAVGRVGLRTLDLAEGEGEVSYWVTPHFRGHGVATRAVATVAEWLLDDLGLHRLSLGHSTRNLASCRVATKAGFELEGTMNSALRHHDGWHDMHWHARIAADPSTARPPDAREG